MCVSSFALAILASIVFFFFFLFASSFWHLKSFFQCAKHPRDKWTLRWCFKESRSSPRLPKIGPKKDLFWPCSDKEKKYSTSSECKMAEQLSKASKKNLKNQEPRKVSLSPKVQTFGRKHQRKGENPVRIPPSTEQCPDFGNSNSWVCKNKACKASLSTDDTFCKRCSCCICHLFDDNKDPSLWLVCTSESGKGDSCGFSCHIECALQREKVGVVDLGQLMQLDGSYCCASCGKVSGILGWVTCLVFMK